MAVPAERLRAALARVRGRALRDLWPSLQATAAATVAWIVARRVFDHPEPFFAPIAAVVALNTTVGERGLNAVKLLQGVVLGIVVGEIALALLGPGFASLALAVFVALVCARAVGGTRIVIAQAAIGAILTIASGDAEVGPDRLADALLGAGIALVFSQVLFAPQPVDLLRRAEASALSRMAGGLRGVVAALDEGDESEAREAIDALRDLHDDLAQLARARAASTRVARRTLVWRSQRAPVVRELEDAGHLDLLGSSCLVLARAAAGADAGERARIAPGLRELADVLAALADDPGHAAARQRAVDRSLEIARRLAPGPVPPDPAAAATVVALRNVTFDLIVFAGADPDEARAAVAESARELEAAAPPPVSHVPFGLGRVAEPLRRLRLRRRRPRTSGEKVGRGVRR
jgi:hypothetical protein